MHMTFVVSIHRQICMDNHYVDEKQIKLFVHIFYNPSRSSSLAEALLFTYEGIALRIIQLITVDMKKNKAKISYLNINYIYRMCNSC